MFLGINTVVDSYSIALVDETDVLGVLPLSTHSGGVEQLSHSIHQLCHRVGGDVRDIRALSIVHGPGPYTSLRLGVSVAKSLSQLVNCPVYGCHTLAMIVSQYQDHNLFFSMIPARYGELNVALFSRNKDGCQRLTDDFHWSYELAIKKLSAIQQPVVLVGVLPDDLMDLCGQEGLDSRLSFRLEGLASDSIAIHAKEMFLSDQEGPYRSLRPLYSHVPVTDSPSSRRRKKIAPKDHRVTF